MSGIELGFCFAVRSGTAMTPAVSCGGGRQARDSQQVVGGGDQVGVPLHPRASAIAGFAQSADGLHPAESLLDPLAHPLTDRITRMPGGAVSNHVNLPGNYHLKLPHLTQEESMEEHLEGVAFRREQWERRRARCCARTWCGRWWRGGNGA